VLLYKHSTVQHHTVVCTDVLWRNGVQLREREDELMALESVHNSTKAQYEGRVTELTSKLKTVQVCSACVCLPAYCHCTCASIAYWQYAGSWQHPHTQVHNLNGTLSVRTTVALVLAVDNPYTHIHDFNGVLCVCEKYCRINATLNSPMLFFCGGNVVGRHVCIFHRMLPASSAQHLKRAGGTQASGQPAQPWSSRLLWLLCRLTPCLPSSQGASGRS
jgi:hypothetical protein